MRRTMSGIARGMAYALVAAAAAGCYAYHSIPPQALKPDDNVHMVLSSAASSGLASTIGPNATALDGRVLSVDQDRVRIALTQIARAVGPEEFLKDEPVEVPLSGALEVTVRSLDRFRTAITVGGLMSSAFLAHTLTTSPGIGTNKGGPATGSK